MDLGLRGAAVVVSGGSKGMGRAAAEVIAAEGAKVAVLARGLAPLEETVRALRDLGAADAVGLRADLGDRAAVDAAFEEVGGRWGRLEVLINAAGPTDVGVGRTFDELDDAEWHATLDIGLVAAARCARAALPWLRRAEWARIINVSAHSVRRQSPGLVAYTAAKAALTSFSKNLSQTLAPEGILVNTVSPGSFLSEGMKNYLAALPPERTVADGDLVAAMRIIGEDFGHPARLGRVALPTEIGPVIAFLASRSNTYMTGADINVDGGSDF
ncbi:SDR family oxidoreductase [Streptomyces sp. WMMC500]|uniref:SDR family NAD(P)-dependent oxidoreductase n=1 Tax=Streptomyces sp. WMMC500 TaxID=3015154 RepID=UPI00248AB438|nr:SDR family oxidoreductase [Streptomyces sp. WMMC500]WBB61272.1 SDR family oxidoreductase [Streptomyces sp. WMMC500]